MAKKKKKPRKRKPEKPLLSVTGILHLQKSFVPPTQESGLLTTVGGALEAQALVLAPNYGYGIPSSLVTQRESQMEENTPPSNIIHVNGVPTITEDRNVIELNEDFPMNDPRRNEANPDDMSISELVRSIGGAKDKPFMRSDVVEDAAVAPSGTEQPPESENVEIENLPEENEFYESLGISRSGKDQTQSIVTEDSGVTKNKDSSTVEADVNASVAEYYKTYCQYYYSSNPEPLGDKPIEFGQAITTEDSVKNESEQSVIELARMAQRAKHAVEAAKFAAQKVYGQVFQGRVESDSYDPLPMEVIPTASADTIVMTKDTTMDQYWEYVKENPRDFNRWTYLVQHSENTKNLVECRKAYSAFLPIFPYCFGYWKRYYEIEKSHLYYQRALSILMKALEFNPLCIDLWQSYLQLFHEIYCHQDNFRQNMREQYERALSSAGLDFRSDALWDHYIDWEINNNDLRKAFSIYRRLINVPTRLYNRHWDNLKALIRDHHPRDYLGKDEYEMFRKKGCKALKYRYKEEPEYEPGEIIKTSKPEDKLMDYLKEKIVSKLEKRKKLNEAETDKRWLFEDKIKRPYFHIKPLDRGQLRNWENYLNFEISLGNHDRTVLLFERCVIACALYERFWIKYARYLEKYHRKECNHGKDVSKHFQKSQITFDVGSRKELIEEEALVATVTQVLKDIIDKVVEEEESEKRIISDLMECILHRVCTANSTDEDCFVHSDTVVSDLSVNNINIGNVSEGGITSSAALSGHSLTELPFNSVEHNINHRDISSLTTQLSVPTFPPAKLFWHDIIRDVYKRACVVHCPRKPTIRLQWAAFEEEIGNVAGAKQLIQHCLEWFPTLIDAKSQMIELERRCGNCDVVLKLFENYLRKPCDTKEFSTLSIKYARFLYKEQGKPDKALAVLRKAVKKDKGNHLLYSYVFDICHERFPTDRKGAAAALELAIQTKEITNEHKLQFIKKKCLFLQEHGELAKYRDSLDQLYEMQELVAADHAKANAVLAEGLRVQVQPHPQVIHPPIWNTQEYVPINFEPTEDVGEITQDTSSNKETEGKYKNVPPTEELWQNLSSYGYRNNHPDIKLQDTLSHREYDTLVSRGYADKIRDQENSCSNAPKGRKRKRRDVPVFIVPPKGPYLADYLAKVKLTNN
ncbi:unnamed protein product [Allacma fusca]|uniref:Pre-mRNA-processing factor 39 n=1 Tax=Allacma fusca TaxID=39272 RepID=A0A8J2K253_9HEXA|nr:unnamed protein product [Allacma fusca]